MPFKKLKDALMVPHLLKIIVCGQALVFLSTSSEAVPLEELVLWGRRIFEGEIWRLFTFMVTPMAGNIFWLLIGLYVTYLIGSALENEWGEVKFCHYVGIGWLATLGVSLVMPNEIITNFFVMSSLTLAFARLFPHVQFYLFLLIPFKVKYLGWLLWAYFGFLLVVAPAPIKLQVFAGISPYAVFFGRETIGDLRLMLRKKSFQKSLAKSESDPFHVCSKCGCTDISRPEMQFRYDGSTCICEKCLNPSSN